MSDISTKLTYLNETKGKIKDAINLTNANILSEDTFRSYAEKLKLGLVDIINNGVDDLYNSFPKTTGAGTEIVLNDTYEAPMEIEYKGNTEQDSLTGINLLDTKNINFSQSGISFVSNEDGEITINGTTFNGNIPLKLNLSFPLNGTYTLIFKKISGTMRTAGSGVTRIRYAIGNSTNIGAANLEGRLITDVFDNNSIIIVTTADINDTLDKFTLYINSGATFENYKFVIYLVSGTYTSENIPNYEPYVGGIPSPNPDYPQDVKVVTGNNTITIGDGTNSESYTINLGTLELCKIGNYQDYLYKDGDNWYKHSEIGKVVLDGSEFWGYGGYTGVFYTTSITDYATSNNIPFSNYYKGVNNVTGAGGMVSENNNVIGFINISGGTTPRFYIKDTRYTNASDTPNLKSWLSTHNIEVYYALATPTYEAITNEELINQLELLYNAKSHDGTTNISITSEDLPMILNVSALSKN